MKSYLILENGMIFKGEHYGSDKEVVSELVFNTSMTGYLEVLTDPSYAGQAVCMTYPLIGNYGICYEDEESVKPALDGFIAREISKTASNFRSEGLLTDYLLQHDIPAICGIDTRMLTRILRDSGTMNCMMTTDDSVFKIVEDPDQNIIKDEWDHLSPDNVIIDDNVMKKIKEYTTGNVVDRVTCDHVITYNPVLSSSEGDIKEDQKKCAKKIALMDFGSKKNIIRSLLSYCCEVMVYPARTKAEDILKENPDGIMLSNGPGDPKACGSIIDEIKKIYDSDIPVFAICLGHQLMALATGATTKKMKYGHRGGNHPVKDLRTGRVYISSQNHGYMVDMDSLDEKIAVPAFINVNDNTNEGLEYTGKKIFTVQFHPEACPGPHDSEFLFKRFLEMMEEDKNA